MVIVKLEIQEMFWQKQPMFKLAQSVHGTHIYWVDFATQSTILYEMATKEMDAIQAWGAMSKGKALMPDGARNLLPCAACIRTQALYTKIGKPIIDASSRFTIVLETYLESLM
jgi:hypothetical protein